MLDFFCSGIQFYLLLSPYLCFISFLYLDLYVLGDDAGVFHATKHLCVFIHIWTKGEVGAPWNRFKPSRKIFLLTVPRRCFLCGSRYFCLVLSCFCGISVLMPCGHLLGKGWPLGSRLRCLIVRLSLSNLYPGSGVMLDCIDSWSLPSFLLSLVVWCLYIVFVSANQFLSVIIYTERNWKLKFYCKFVWVKSNKSDIIPYMDLPFLTNFTEWLLTLLGQPSMSIL